MGGVCVWVGFPSCDLLFDSRLCNRSMCENVELFLILNLKPQVDQMTLLEAVFVTRVQDTDGLFVERGQVLSLLLHQLAIFTNSHKDQKGFYV